MSEKGKITKNRIINTASNLLKQRGYFATGLKDIIDIAKVPKGSIYYHFPEGKDQIVKVSVNHLSKDISNILNDLPSSQNFFTEVIDLFINELKNSNFISSCPITTVALETSDRSTINTACKGAYEEWITILLKKSKVHFKNINHTDIEQIFCLIEGAIMMSFVMKDIKYLENSKLTIQKMLPLHK